jgi:hypothetical protein
VEEEEEDTTRKRLIVGAPKNPTAGAPEPAGGNRSVIMGYCRRTSMCASGNTSYCRCTSWCAGGIISRIQKKVKSRSRSRCRSSSSS